MRSFIVKLKTKKSAVKRFKKINESLFKYKKTKMRHLLTKKSRNKKRHLRKFAYTKKCQLKLIKKMFM